MKRTIACVIARTTSTRLPLKVLRSVIGSYSLLDFMLQRLKIVNNISDIYLCTSQEPVDDIMEDIAAKNGVKLYRGSAEAVIERMIGVGELENADNVIRITGDNVFTSCEYLDEQIEIHNSNDLEYTRIINVPIGATAEVISLSALKRCYASIDPAVSEYLLLFMFRPEAYKCGVIEIKGLPKSDHMTLTVDTPADLIRTKTVLANYIGEPLTISLREILELVERYQIADCTFTTGSTVKLPYSKSVSYADFQTDMNDRKARSESFTIGVI